MPWVLVVEDDQDLCEIIQEVCEEAQVKTLFANTSLAATEKTTNQKFDLILLDINLQKGSGIDVLERIRVPSNLNFSTNVILMSGNLETEILKEYGKKIQGALVKPYEISRLMELIKKFTS